MTMTMTMTARDGEIGSGGTVPVHAIRARRFLVIGLCLLIAGCTRPPANPEPAPARPSQIKVDVTPGGPIVLTTSSAEFQVLPSGYIQASLFKGHQKITMDAPSPGGSNFLVQDGKEVHLALDFAQAKVQDSAGKLGRGKRVEVPVRPLDGPSSLQQALLGTLQIEVYDDFPNVLLSSAEYKNNGSAELRIDRVVEQQHRFSGSLTDKKAQPYDMWSFHGSSYDWGKDDVVKMTRSFSQPNLMGAAVKGGYGGGIPVVAFWNASVGEAVGHVETVPLTLSLPVKVGAEGVDAGVDIDANTVLQAEAFLLHMSSAPLSVRLPLEPCILDRDRCRSSAEPSCLPRWMTHSGSHRQPSVGVPGAGLAEGWMVRPLFGRTGTSPRFPA